MDISEQLNKPIVSHEDWLNWPVIRPEDWWPVDPEFAKHYDYKVEVGRNLAAEGNVAVVMLCRNSMPFLVNTCRLLAELSGRFRSCRHFWLENDSTDGTAEAMEELAAFVVPGSNGRVGRVETEHQTLGALDERGFSAERTTRLAGLRNRCLEWVRALDRRPEWTIVLDSDPHGGFSVDGVLHSIACLESPATLTGVWTHGCMASYGVMRAERTHGPGHGIGPHKLYQYDGWAARQNDWRDRRDEVGFSWFFTNLPAVGSQPIPMYSAFGGLAVYKTEAFLDGGYEGGDCEHVAHHRRMRAMCWSVHINPGCRYVAW